MRRWLGLIVLFGCKPADPAARTAGTIAVEAAPGPVMSTHQLLTVEVEPSSTVWAACARVDDPEDVVLAESTEAGAAHVLEVFGLAVGSNYTCEVVAPEAGASAEVTVEVEPLPDEYPELRVDRDATVPSWGAWTLTNSTRGCFAGDTPSHVFVVDPDGRVRWAWRAGTGYVADIDGSWLEDQQRFHFGGGWGLFQETDPHRGFMAQLDRSGQVLLERDAPDFGLGFNHHSQPLPSGEILNLTTSREDDGDEVVWWHGVAVELWDPETEAPTWTWSSQGLVDAGLEGPYGFAASPYHANSVSFVEDPLGSAMYVSLYLGREIWRIDRATGERTHTIGPFGQMTLQDADGNALGDADWFWGQHDPEYTVVGDEVVVLLHDNGADRPGVPYSRVAEVELDLVANTVTLGWTWTEPGWFNPIVGDADRLPNGNVLVTKGFMQCYTPWSDEGSQLVEVDPASGAVAWRMTWVDPEFLAYRAERYDGCDLFANAKYCPDVAERLAALRAN